MYFSARTEGRISYGHLGRTDSCFTCVDLYLLLVINKFDLILNIYFMASNARHSDATGSESE